MEALVEEVRQFAGERLGIQPGTLTPETTLTGGLGLDGNRAAEFLDAFEDEFDTDLSALYQDWDRYFSPEEAIPRELIIPLLAMGMTAGLTAWLSFPVFLVAGLYAARHYRRRTGAPTAEITLAALTEAARLGYWPECYLGTRIAGENTGRLPK